FRPRVIAVRLNIQRPFINSPRDSFVDFSRIADELGESEAWRLALRHEGHVTNTDYWDDTFEDLTVRAVLSKRPELLREFCMPAWVLFDDESAVRAMKANRFDGGIHAGSGASLDSVEYKVFDEAQVIEESQWQDL
ncbi:MAG: hypothetical protein ACREMA_14555, partial [Longimicrobiales bacterium]